MIATDQRQTLAEYAETTGWQRRKVDRTDYYAKDIVRVQVLWCGTEAISGSSLYHDDLLYAYTRDLSTVQSWLKR
jgi:hypothetical protein